MIIIMKRVTKLLIVILLGISLAGCNLEENPKNAIELDGETLTTVEHLSSFRNGIYSIARAMYAPGNFIASDMAVEYMDALITYNNSYTDVQLWATTKDSSYYVNLWYYAYRLISNINFFFEHYEPIENELLDIAEEDRTTQQIADLDLIKRIKGECYLFRAMAEYLLVKFYCGNYDSATASDPNTGIVISRKYDAWAQNPRSTLDESYDNILADIEDAAVYLEDVTGPYTLEINTTTSGLYTARLNIDCVYALQAQVYLQKGKDFYTQAAAAVKKLYDGGHYALENSVANLNNLWVNDTSSELIYSFYASSAEGGASYDYTMFNWIQNGNYNINYIPTQWMLDLYSTSDYRRSVYFSQQSVTINNLRPKLYIFNKYSGNPALREVTDTNNYLNSVKVFRYADMLLIGAEAAAQSNDLATANNYLNTLRSNRISGWSYTSYSASDIMNEIKTERARELAMEGSRLNDLKRWGDNMVRNNNSQTAGGVSITNQNLGNVAITGGDSRFVWPIPGQERDGNPNIVQNPGW